MQNRWVEVLAVGINLVGALGCARSQSSGSGLSDGDARVIAELEGLTTQGNDLARIYEISIALGRQWPSSKRLIRQLLSSRMPSLNLAGLNGLACVKGEIDDETRAAAAALVESPHPQVKVWAVGWTPGEGHLRAYEAFGRELLGAVTRWHTPNPIATTTWLGIAAELPANKSIDEIACGLLMCADMGVRTAAADCLAERRSQLAIRYAIRLMQENRSNYFERQRQAAGLLNRLAEVEIPFEATSMSRSPWLAEIIDALIIWNRQGEEIGREGGQAPAFRVPPKPVEDQGPFIRGDPRQDEID